MRGAVRVGEGRYYVSLSEMEMSVKTESLSDAVALARRDNAAFVKTLGRVGPDFRASIKCTVRRDFKAAFTVFTPPVRR